ncbi:alpha-N-arabinofuranosidase A [Dendryphion nanum]|uniref:non-reducing end alpha-L-arabinofuranosidase n=1 Tax=Dendryphion nanum TaxID=256645 RepID=A0A9P9IUD2_9PLEO|nr:alpha-N-arabinofuranosidase A [Dendryphion nanum]
MISIKSVLAALAVVHAAGAVDIFVHSGGGNKTTSIPYGLMHEDINNAGDGGIYAELIRNRAFQGSPQFPVSLSGWSSINGALLSISKLSKPLSSALPSNLHVRVPSSENSTAKEIGFANDGFWGIAVRKQEYQGSFYVKGSYEGKFTASLRSTIANETFASVDISSKISQSDDWTQHSFTLVPTKDAPSSNNSFVITFDAAGVNGGALDFNLISLFPPTFKGRVNGLRKDIAEPLHALKPKFLRFPGGNALEGPSLAYPWLWNETIGLLKDRPGRPGAWGYQTSDGLGLVEYLQWAEDMDSEPILGIWAGLALDGAYINDTDLQPWIDDALNEIEFVRGDASTPYGKLRASLGYPKPWKLNYVEIGNEDWLAGRPSGFQSYIKYRFPRFKAAIEQKYPDIQIIASPSIWDNMIIPAPAAGDYHPYLEPDKFYNEFNKFDRLTKDNLTLVGEFSSTHPNGGSSWNGNLHPFPWWIGGVGEAIFMIGAERNGDRIIGSTYAPILRNMNRWQWSICMIEFEADSTKTSLSTSYHVFKLFSERPLSATLPTTPSANTSSLFWVAGVNEVTSLPVFKAANYNTTDHQPTPVSLAFEGLDEGTQAEFTLLTSSDGPFGYNDPKKGNNVVIESKKVLKAGINGTFAFELPELSIAVLEVSKKAVKVRP